MAENKGKKDDSVEIPVGKFFESMRKNPWIIATIVLVIILVIVIFVKSGGTGASGAIISSQAAGQEILNLAKAQVSGSSVTLNSVQRVGDHYEVSINVGSSPYTVLVSLDGNYLLQQINPTNSGSSNNTKTTADVSAFPENSTLYPSLGSSNASATVIEFSDFQCPYCSIAAGLSSFAKQYGTGQYADLFGVAGKVEQLAKNGKIRFIYVPLGFLGQESVNAAEAAYCAADQGKFWDMHDALFAANDGNENNGKFAIDKLELIAQNITGINQATFKTCLESSKYASQVSQVTSATNAAGVQIATPQFFVNGQQVGAGWSSISGALQSLGVNTG